MSLAEIAAIVVTYRTGPRLRECLYALKAHVDIAQIVIVDNGNPPEMVAWLKTFTARTPKALYLETGENLGFGSAVNRGAARAKAANLLVINPDCVMRPDALEPLVAASAGLASPWIVGGRIFDLKGVNQRGPMRRELTVARVLSKLVGGAGIDMALEPKPSGPIAVDVISGAFFLIDKEGFQALGGFDEGYFLHVEDIDLCKRARLAGGSVVYQPFAGALHVGATSDVPSVFVEKHKAVSFARYFRKFSKGVLHRFSSEVAILLIYLGLALRAWFKQRRAR